VPQNILKTLITGVMLVFCLAACTAVPAAPVPQPPATDESISPLGALAALPNLTNFDDDICEGMTVGQNQSNDAVDLPLSFTVTPESTARETVAAYFAWQYKGYADLSFVDISPLLDMQRTDNQNLIVWLQMLTQRRKLLADMDLCFVETAESPYEIVYDEMPEDDRLAFWSRRAPIDADAVLHFRIKGTPGAVYPPTFAANAQHTMFLQKSDEGWKIIRHYYPGSVRNFRQSGTLTLVGETEMRQALKTEFSPAALKLSATPAAGAIAYDAKAAADYAMRYAETPNPAFYLIGDWQGNCANFVSQAVSSGFSGRMSRDWFAGGGGGSPAWENVDHFWAYAIGANAMKVTVLPTVASMKPGDVLLTRTANAANPDDYRHSLILVDANKMIFAQNSPGNFVYLSDMVNIESRILSPVSLLV
jgi:hypothetical protein